MIAWTNVLRRFIHVLLQSLTNHMSYLKILVLQPVLILNSPQSFYWESLKQAEGVPELKAHLHVRLLARLIVQPRPCQGIRQGGLL